MSVVDEIKARVNIVDYIQRYVPIKKAGKYYKAPCPFHNERTPSFVVNDDRQTWHCFGACGEGGDIFSFAEKYHGWSFYETLQELARETGVELKPQTPEQKQQTDTRERLLGLLDTIADFYYQQLFEPQFAEVLAYVQQKRGLNEDTIYNFGIGYAPAGWRNALDYLTQLGYSEDEIVEAGIANRKEETGRVYDRFRNRLMIPICDARGRAIGFGARALAPDDNPKYLNSPQTPLFDKSSVLFGLDLAGKSIRDSETAVIVEGYMDAIQAHQAGYTNVIAQMGTAMTEAQLQQIAPRWAKTIIMALDADAAGQSATMRGLNVAREALQADYSGKLAVDIRILTIPGAKDPDDLIRETPDQWQTLVDNALPVADYVIEVEAGKLSEKASLQQREETAKRVLPLLIASENDLYKQDNLQKLAVRLRIMERDLLVWAQQIKQAPPPPAPRQAAQPDYPEPPPLDYDAIAPPPEEDEAFNTVPPLRLVKPQTAHRDAPVERHCLQTLWYNPELYYQVNRKFRELADNDRNLLQGPLADFEPDDFSRDTHRALMRVFQSALEQDNMEPLDFARTQLEPSLLHALEDLLEEDEAVIVQQQLKFGRKDLQVIQKEHNRFHKTTNLQADLEKNALRLRKERIARERQEISFLQMENVQQDTDDHGDDIDTTHLEYARYVRLLQGAQQRIDAELKRAGRRYS